MSAFGFYVFWGGGWDISSHPGAFTVVLSAKGKYISAKQKFIYQIRGIYVKLNLILKKKKNGHRIH